MPTNKYAALPLNSLLLLLLLLLLGTAYRAWALQLSGLNLYVDEAQYWYWAQSLDWGYYSKPPMIAALIAATTAAFGDSEFAVKSGALLLYPLTTLVLWMLALRLYGSRVAMWTAIVFFTLPGVAFSSLIISTDVALFLFWTLALYAFWMALQSNHWGWWLLMGAACGLGLLTKYTMGIFAVSAIAFCAATPRHRHHLRSLRPWAAAALAALIFLPNLIWNAQNGWPTLTHTAEISNLDGGAGLHWDELGEFIGGQAAIIGPLLFLALLWRVAQLRDWWQSERERFLAIFSLTFLLIICAQALFGRANANWAAMAYASGTVWVVSWLLARQQRWLLVLAIGLHLLLAGLAYHYHGLMQGAGIPLSAKAKPAECWRALTGSDEKAHCPDFYKRVQGWDTLGTKVAAVLKAHPNTLLLANERDTMSELAYYARPESQGAVMWNPKHTVHNHYQLVTTLDGKGNRNLLFVSRDQKLPEGMAESFLGQQSLGSLSVPVVPGHALNYQLTLLQGYMGYPLWLTGEAARKTR